MYLLLKIHYSIGAPNISQAKRTLFIKRFERKKKKKATTDQNAEHRNKIHDKTKVLIRHQHSLK